MSHTFVLLVAMSGLGCQNKPVEPGDLPPVISPAPASPAARGVLRQHQSASVSPLFPRRLPRRRGSVQHASGPMEQHVLEFHPRA